MNLRRYHCDGSSRDLPFYHMTKVARMDLKARRQFESGPHLHCFVQGEREGQYLFSITYRISLLPFPFAVVSIFTSLLSKGASDLYFILRCVTLPTYAIFFLRLASLLDSLIAPAKKPLACSQSYMYIVSCHTVLQCVSLPRRG
jgi:hypothetical protein